MAAEGGDVSINLGDDTVRRGSAALLNRTRSFYRSLMSLGWGPLFGLLVVHGDAKQTTVFVQACVLSAGATGACGTILSLFIADNSPDATLSRFQYVLIKSLVHLFTIPLMITAYALLLSVNTGHAVLALVLITTASLVAVLLWKTMPVPLEAHTAAFAGCDGELDRLLELSTNVATILYGGLSGRAVGCFKIFTEITTESPNSGRGDFNVPELLLFVGALSSALAMVANLLPPVVTGPDPKEVIAVLERLGGFAAMIVVLTMLSFTYGLMRDYMVLAVVPEMVAAVVWAAYLGCEAPPAVGEAPPEHRPVSLEFTILAVGGAAAVYLKSGGNSASRVEGVFYLFFSAAIVSGLCWRLLVHRPPANPGTKKVVGILSFSHKVSILVSLPLFMFFMWETIF